MPKALVIVESPAKAKTIEKFLGKSHYSVKASVGHIRDLPKSRLGVDIENNFEPEYINIRGKGDIIKELKKEAKKATKIYLATDPDREGEAISWHLSYILGIDADSDCRIEFNEITKDTIKKSIKQPRKLNHNLIDAQQARRVLDRLLGYQISPVLWQKVRRGLSAGRVQSVTTKIICDREKEINEFVPTEYWSLNVISNVNNTDVDFSFYGIDADKIDLNNEADVNAIIEKIKNRKLLVSNIDTKIRRRSAVKPFTTSMLQQEAVNRLGFTTKKAMRIAQELYEGIDISGEGTIGLISYIRTDSQRISDEAKEASKKYIYSEFGDNYHIGDKKSTQKTKKNAQDAHEAIRPTSVNREPDKIKSSLSKDQYKLYNLIWRRFVASQMADAIYENVSIECKIDNYIFRATGSKQIFDGYTRVYNFTDRDDKILPQIEIGDKLDITEILPKQHFTQPPARYTEASLVKTLEELGIGRPSTYAPTIGTILTRGYVEKEGQSIKPTELGEIVTEILEDNFEMLTDVDFTAKLETLLDEVEDGEVQWKKVIQEAYEPLESSIKTALENIEKVNMDIEVDEKCELCGSNMVIKHGRFGKFMACKNYPECKFTKPIVEKLGVKCPKCNDGDVIIRKTKSGRVFYGCSNYPDCDFVEWNKPTGEVCESCGAYMVEKNSKKESKSICSNSECVTNASTKSKKKVKKD
ncbi:type I DNA topoisomerase [Peptostreptococcus anaerobius]|uniref:DNA topoisomerase 1 n=1 Tax=Peptostreptococcus porci TaxID=2652282 RepID=A0A6N7XEJ7_9FIRM|nr:type I DNA topoisomerase [Peptostreptococcus porci]MDY4127271.1 type I DNA topoisomerase [Peptostreptococcus porci]MDY4561247.1 type I DNA topoisomerase [Peptostreptococcus porci]MST62003.1 type I DNA topoisomerase [Peptostreptococcus porci]